MSRLRYNLGRDGEPLLMLPGYPLPACCLEAVIAP